MRKHAGIADLSAFSKLEISGDDVDQYLNRIQCNKLPKNQGSISLTYMIMPNGRIEGETTLVKLGDNHYYSVYAAAKEAALLDWLHNQILPDEQVIIQNVSEQYGVIMLAGPMSRKILAECTDADLHNANFRWLSTQHINVAGIDRVRAMRVTYTGELGWELHIPMHGMSAIYNALISTRYSDGLVHVGSATLNAMRMEKAYRSGHEITNEVTVTEAGVERFSREHGFQGAEQTLMPAQNWVLAYLSLDEVEEDEIAADPLGSETVWHNGRKAGHLSSGGFGHATGKYLSFAYLKPESAKPGTVLDVSVLAKPRRALVLKDAVWDPLNTLPRSDD